MKSVFRFFMQTTLVVAIGFGVSLFLLAAMPLATEKLQTIELPETGIAVFLDAPKSEKSGQQTSERLVIDEASQEEGTAKRISLAENTTSTPVLLNIAPPRLAATPFKKVKIAEFGTFLKDTRQQGRVKLDELKKATGLTEQQLLNIENGKTVPTPELAMSFESVLQIDVLYK